MKLYTVDFTGTRKILFTPKGSDNLYDLSETSLNFKDMNEVIATCTSDQINILAEKGIRPFTFLKEHRLFQALMQKFHPIRGLWEAWIMKRNWQSSLAGMRKM